MGLVEEREISVPAAGGEMTTFTVHPDGDGPFPVAILYMDGVGYREQVKENARRFAAGGFYVVVPDLFHRAGQGVTFDFSKVVTGSDAAERDRMMAVISTVTPDGAGDDTRAALEAIGDDPAAAPGPRVCVGYCMGARLALHAASEFPEEFVAGAGIHPGALITDAPDSPHRDLAGVRGELYFSFAEQDHSATPEVVDRFRREMEDRGVRGEVERVPGTRHGFAMADLPVYDAAAADRHFERTLDLWHRNLS